MSQIVGEALSNSSRDHAMSDGFLLGTIFIGLTNFDIVLPRASVQNSTRGEASLLGGIRQPPKELTRYDLRFARAGTALWLHRNAPYVFEAVHRLLCNETTGVHLDPLELVPRIVGMFAAGVGEKYNTERVGNLAQLIVGSLPNASGSEVPDWHDLLLRMALVQANLPERCPVSPLIEWAIEVETDRNEPSLDQRQRYLDDIIGDWNGVSGFDLNRWACFLLSLELHRAATPLAKRAVDAASTTEYFPIEVRRSMTEQDKDYNVAACHDTYGWALCYEGTLSDAGAPLSFAIEHLAPYRHSNDWCEVQYHRTHAAFWLDKKDEANQIVQAMLEANATSVWTRRAQTFFSAKIEEKPRYGKEYEIVLSFAGEERALANQIAERLSRRGISVFYDDFERASLWGKNLYEYLTDIYQNRGRYCVLLLSENYKRKRWTRLEWRAVQARCFLEGSEYCLPIRLDDTDLPGLLPTTGYLSLKDMDVDQIVDTVWSKLYGGNASQRTARR